MKNKLKLYLDLYQKYWKEETGDLPKACYDEDLDTQMYVGDVDEEGYIQWNYIEQEAKKDFFDECEFKLRDDVKEFLTSFYFMDFSGFIDGQRIDIESINEESELVDKIEEYDDGEILVSLGMLSPIDLPLYIENSTGNIVLVDYETEEKQVVFESLSDLFGSMKPYK